MHGVVRSIIILLCLWNATSIWLCESVAQGVEVNISSSSINYPVGLQRDGIEGYALVMTHIADSGLVMDALWIESNHRSFGVAAEKGLKGAIVTLKPEQLNDVIIPLRIDFEAEGTGSSSSYAPMLKPFLGLGPDKIIKNVEPLSNLESKLTVIEAPKIQVPLDASGERITGTVTAKYYIDEEGKVRLPAITKLIGGEILGYIAMDALYNTRYSIPMSEGKPVNVQAEQTFVFK